MIPLVDLKAQYQSIRHELDAAVQSVLASGEYIQGREVATFEHEFAAYCGGGEAMGVNSGTSALHLALLAAGVGPGDEVITVSMTFVATVSAIAYTGARPVLIDIDPGTWNMDPARIEDAITPRTKAIVPVHLHGRVAEMDSILEIARRRGLFVIEDAAQAHGAEYRGRRAGSFGDAACFSFYASKNLGAVGEGGAIVSRDSKIIERVRMLRDWGARRKYHHELRGYNYRMENLQGAVLRVKLRHLEGWTQRRGAVAAAYDARLGRLGIARPASVGDGNRHAFHIYAVRVRGRDALQARLATANIQTGIHYPVPVHLQPAYSDLGYSAGDLPATEALASETLSLPVFPEMTEAQIETVCAGIAHEILPYRKAGNL